MALSQQTIFPTKPNKPSLSSNFLPPLKPTKLRPPNPISCSSPSLKIVRNPSLDKHIVKQSKIRFVQKLKTLLLSKPKHYIPIRILYKCRSYLSLHKPKSILSMIHRYPSVFRLFIIPSQSPMSPNCEQLCVGLTESALAHSEEESKLRALMSSVLANKLQKLLMLSTHHRLLLNKLVHLGPDLGLPRNFRSCLCNQYPDRFKVVDTSYGRALELVSWDSALAVPLKNTHLRDWTKDLIVERPLKFKHLRLRRGLNVKRKHREYLMKFQEMGEVELYREEAGESGIAPESMAAEKRACGVVREVLGMTVERRTLVDHLTHFRKDFGLPNKLRGMIVRHPELFYVSLKGERDSVFLLEGYDEKGGLAVKDELVEAKERLMGLVRESKVMRRERRRRRSNGGCDESDVDDFVAFDGGDGDDDDDGFEDLFVEDDDGWESFGDDEGEVGEELVFGDGGEVQFWSAEASVGDVGRSLEHW